MAASFWTIVDFVIEDNKMYMYNIQPELESGDKVMTHYKLTFTYKDLYGNELWSYTTDTITTKCNLKD